jgi:alkylated DNA repair dioxygenase AlkB
LDQLIDLDRYPLDRPHAAPWQALVDACRLSLASDGMFSLEGLLRPAAQTQALAQVMPVMDADSFLHSRTHNIYFRPHIPELEIGHPALHQSVTSNRQICADQMSGSILLALYEWPPLAAFLAAALEKPALFTMADPLARVNVMEYRDGETLGWHFDRSEFTTTLLLQAPLAGGAFEYRTGLRSATDPNYAGVARLLTGKDPAVQALHAAPGTLNVFKGKDTAHRVAPVCGPQGRVVAVFSYYEQPGVVFSPEEQRGFYGRTKASVPF